MVIPNGLWDVPGNAMYLCSDQFRPKARHSARLMVLNFSSWFLICWTSLKSKLLNT